MNESRFDGGVIPYIGYVLLFWIAGWLTLGLAVPWVMASFQRWKAGHTVIDGRRLVFEGSGTQLLGNYIKWLILTIITLGIYGFWLFNKMTAWQVRHTHTADGSW